MLCYIVLGGKHSDGWDATNDLTYMALEATTKMNLVSPVITVRLSKDSTEALYRKSAECMQAKTGYPFVFNDDVIIEALKKIGISEEDTNVYANDGCWETVIPGKTEFRYSNIELLQCLELALNRGKSRITGEKIGVDSGDPLEFKTFEDLQPAPWSGCFNRDRCGFR